MNRPPVLIDTTGPVAASSHVANTEKPRGVSAGIVEWNRAASEFWAARTRPLRPLWFRLSKSRRQDHIDGCLHTCPTCENYRAFGECTRCGTETEAIGPDELSRCCGVRMILTPEDDDRRTA